MTRLRAPKHFFNTSVVDALTGLFCSRQRARRGGYRHDLLDSCADKLGLAFLYGIHRERMRSEYESAEAENTLAM